MEDKVYFLFSEIKKKGSSWLKAWYTYIVTWRLTAGVVQSELMFIIGQQLANAWLLRSWRTFAWHWVCQEAWKPEQSIARHRFAKHVSDTRGLVAVGLRHAPVTSDRQIATDEPFKGVFCPQSTPSYKRACKSFAGGIRKTDVIRASQSQWNRRCSWSRKEWNES
jgi:hypothetical protein